MESGSPGGPASAFESPTFNLDISIGVDQPVGSASISPCGRDIALASRQGLHIIDLDNIYSPPRYLSHQTPWEVADVQWSPFAARDYWVVSTSNQKALVWNLAISTPHSSVEFILHAHSRAITDINFSAHDPDVLATCAVDSFVHCWDLRIPARPVATFCDWFAGATQVKWNRQDSHVIASSHDKWLRIWDNRWGAVPMQSIKAHETKIYGVDWNRTRPKAVVTCSLDKTIKFWDYEKDTEVPERIIRTPFPVWRARHTPFGWGICAMPQRDSNDLHLYDRRLEDGIARDGEVSPAHRFEGHEDQVKEFLWRPRGTITDGVDNREFQLVSWGADRQLRLHRLDDSMLQKVGYQKGETVRRKYNYTRKGAAYKTYHDDSIALDQKSPRPTSGLQALQEQGSNMGVKGMLTAGITTSYGPLSSTMAQQMPVPVRVGMYGRSIARRDVDLIEWMKGVRIGKSKTRNGFVRRSSMSHNPSAYLPHNFGNTGPWDSPETFYEEITRVGVTYKKVSVEDVNGQSRAAVISMNGPWGAESKDVHVKINVTFPSDYPEASSPSFRLEKTASISEEIVESLSLGIQLIAQGFVSRKRGCLEPVVCYLLGERGLEESTAALNDVNDDDDDDALGESSSEEDVDEAVDVSKTDTEEDLEMSGNDLLGTRDANAKVPLAKCCGAMFAENGTLVCFFPRREEKSVAGFSTFPLKDSERATRSQKMYAGFGRIQTISPGPKTRFPSVDDANEDNDSDDSWTESSGSSFRSGASFPRWHAPQLLRGKRRLDKNPPPAPVSADHSTRSGGPSSGPRKFSSNKSKSVVSLKVFDDLIPSKDYLAKEYLIFGDGPVVCGHNAQVATKYGHHDLAETWKLAQHILYNEIPLEVLDQRYRREPILVIARLANQDVQRRDSGTDLEHNEGNPEVRRQLKGRVKWGKHTFAAPWLTTKLFEYYEHLADTQMLAMLSCIFSEPAARGSVSNKLIEHRQQDLPLSMKSPAFSLDYFSSEKTAWSLFQPTLSVPSGSRPVHTPLETYGSAGSSNGPWESDRFAHSVGVPAFHPYKSDRLSPANIDLRAPSPSSSPELHVLRKSTTAPATQMTRALPSGPTSPVARKKPSPVENMLVNLTASGVTWGTNTIWGSTVPDTSPSLDVVTYSESGSSNNEGVRVRKRTFKVIRRNRNTVDSEGSVSAPLLDPERMSLYRSYRTAYAKLLDVWGLPLACLEILKFNGLRSYFPDTTEDDESLITLGKKRDETTLLNKTSGLELARHCRRCSAQVPRRDSSGGNSYCDDCGTLQIWKTCQVCSEIIRGLYAGCLVCGHTYHKSCFSEWSNMSRVGCPCGCGCPCLDKVDMEEEERSMESLQDLRDENDETLYDIDTDELGGDTRVFGWAFAGGLQLHAGVD